MTDSKSIYRPRPSSITKEHITYEELIIFITDMSVYIYILPIYFLCMQHIHITLFIIRYIIY